MGRIAQRTDPGGSAVIYTRKELAIMAYVFGLLTGLIVAFASCSPTSDSQHDHITTGAHQ